MTEDGPRIVLDNGLVRVTVDERGLLTSVYDDRVRARGVAPGAAGNLLQLHVDTPNMWDAWDVDAFYRNKVTDLVDVDGIEVVERDTGGGRGGGHPVLRVLHASRRSSASGGRVSSRG